MWKKSLFSSDLKLSVLVLFNTWGVKSQEHRSSFQNVFIGAPGGLLL